MLFIGFWNISYMAGLRCHIWLAFVVTGCLTFLSSNAFSELNTYQIKSAYLYQISKFVFWPEEQKQADAFNLCVLGPDTYGGNLQKMEGRTVFNKPVRVQPIKSLKKSDSCHLIVLTQPKKMDAKSLHAWLKDNPTLVVSDGEDYIDKAMVVFVLENNRVRLHINMDLAKHSGITFAANLLEVASRVKTGGTP